MELVSSDSNLFREIFFFLPLGVYHQTRMLEMLLPTPLATGKQQQQQRILYKRQISRFALDIPERHQLK